jgi:hypothetical protein
VLPCPVAGKLRTVQLTRKDDDSIASELQPREVDPNNFLSRLQEMIELLCLLASSVLTYYANEEPSQVVLPVDSYVCSIL